MVSVPEEIELVFVRSVNETPLNTAAPPAVPGPIPKNGCGGACISAPPEPPIAQRVTVESSGEHSTSLTFAERPVICTTSPDRLGIANCTGLLLATAPKCQPASATAKKLVASGTMVHGGETVKLVALFAVTVRSCPRSEE